MIFSGTAQCKNGYDAYVMTSKLELIPGAEVETEGLLVSVTYEASDKETDDEARFKIANIMDIVSSCHVHGFSVV